jgi:SET domain-containing protein
MPSRTTPTPAADGSLDTTSAPDLDVRASTVHGLGAFVRRGVQKGHVLGPYTGRRLSPAQVAQQDWNNALTYVFGLADGSVIDGAVGGNATRHINHSCAPNVQAFEVEDEDGTASVVIEAKRRLRAGEELFLDYALDIGEDDPADYPCHCGSPRCRGTMAGS